MTPIYVECLFLVTEENVFFIEKKNKHLYEKREVKDLVCVVSPPDANCRLVLFVSTLLPQILPMRTAT
jgi:hypothetical protein